MSESRGKGSILVHILLEFILSQPKKSFEANKKVTIKVALDLI